jgi:hypothetical protein
MAFLFGLMSWVAVPLCSDLARLAALKQYQGEEDGQDEQTPGTGQQCLAHAVV